MLGPPDAARRTLASLRLAHQLSVESLFDISSSMQRCQVELQLRQFCCQGVVLRMSKLQFCCISGPWQSQLLSPRAEDCVPVAFLPGESLVHLTLAGTGWTPVPVMPRVLGPPRVLEGRCVTHVSLCFHGAVPELAEQAAPSCLPLLLAPGTAPWAE